MVEQVRDGDVILLHDMCDCSVTAALRIVDTLQKQGFQFVTVSELAAIRQEQSKASTQELDIAAIREELEKQLSFEGEINTALVATILDKVVVKKESTKEEIHLDIYLKLGQKYEAIYSPQVLPAGINPPRSTTHKLRIRRI